MFIQAIQESINFLLNILSKILFKQKRIELSDNEFLTMEDENYYSVKKEL